MKWKVFNNNGLPQIKSDPFDVLGTVIGGIMQSQDTEATNAKNANIAWQNREWQSKENEIQRQWEEQQKQVERQYNTPAAQMQRYKEAGLNPFLMGQGGQVGSGQTQAPVAPAPQSAPGFIPMQKSNIGDYFARGLGGVMEYLLQKQSVDANSANQNAQAEREIIKNAVEIMKFFGHDAAKKYYSTRMSELHGASIDSSVGWQNFMEQYHEQKYRTQMQEVEASIASKYGERRAETELAKMNDQMMQIHAQVGLWSSLARLNDSNVSLNSAYERRVESEIIRNVADSARAFAESNYVKSLKLTNDELRDYIVASTMFEAANRGLLFGENEANFAEGEGRREYQHSDVAKSREAWSYSYDKNYVYQTVSKTLDLVQKGVGSVIPFKHSSNVPKAPWQTGYVKHNATRPTYSGKEEIEWYAPYNP